MTAQEIMDLEGWIPFGSRRLRDNGEVLECTGGMIPVGSKVVVIGRLTVQELEAAALRHGKKYLKNFPYYYKVVAE